jgi:beta-lactamase regulating signal transducer with metallopeptidase domain
MSGIFLSVLNMSLTGAFVIAVIVFARLPLKRAPKWISYCLWAVAAFRLIVPFSFESLFSLVPSGMPQIDAPVRAYMPSSVENRAYVPEPAGGSYALDSLPVMNWSDAAARVWLAGIVAMLIYCVISTLLLRRRLREALPCAGNIYETDTIKTPLVFGLFRPRIYLPIGLSGGEREYILLHEETHIRRRDCLVKFFAFLVLCVHWFNPFVWLAFVLMAADMETSCDERVMRELGGTSRSGFGRLENLKADYAMSLVRLAAERRIIGASPLAFGEGGVKERVKNVLKFKKPARIVIITAVVLAAALAIGLAVNRADLVFDFDGVTKIAVRSGTTGNPIEITDSEDVRKIAGFFGGRRFTREKAPDGTGWNVALMFYEGDKLIENITVLNESHIDVAAARYGCRDADIDTDYLESLIASASAGDRRPMLMVGGILYFDTGRQLPAEVDESAVLGTVASSVSQSEAPSRDGQSNFGKIGAKYAYFENGVAVLIDGEWVFFEKDSSSAAPDYADSEYGFALSFPFEYGDAIEVNPAPADDSPMQFELTAPQYGIGVIAYLDVWLSAASYRSDYSAMDVPFTELGSNGRYDFVLVQATDLPLDPVNDENGAAFLAIRDAFDAGQYRFTLIDADDPTPNGSLLSPLSDLPADYGAYENREKAISDGVYVSVQGAEIYNQATVDFFYKDFFEGRVAFMRTIEYTVEGDPIIKDYEHDGKIFIVVTDTTRDKFGSPEIFTETYRYLVPLDRSRPAGTPMPFYLSNDENIYEGTPDGDGARLKTDGLGMIPSPSDSVGSLFL